MLVIWGGGRDRKNWDVAENFENFEWQNIWGGSKEGGAARNNQHSSMPNIQHNIHSWPPVFLIFLKGIKMHGYGGKMKSFWRSCWVW